MSNLQALQTLYTKMKKENDKLRKELALQNTLGDVKLYSRRKLEKERLKLISYCEQFHTFGGCLDFNGPSEKLAVNGFVKTLFQYRKDYLNKGKGNE